MSKFSQAPIVCTSGINRTQPRNGIASIHFAKSAFLCALILGLLAPVLYGQQQTAQLTGQITDASGAVIAGATVTVTNAARGIKIETKSGPRGQYVVPLLPPDDGYQISVEKQGFKTAKRPGLTLEVAQVARVDIALELGSVVEDVVVTGAPPLLDSQTSSTGEVIGQRSIINLPLNGRSSFRLVQLTPGTVFTGQAYGQFGDVPVNTNQDSNISINGGSRKGNEILIDGVPAGAGFFNSITSIPSVDDTQEFKVQSNNLPAQYGRFSGGVINIETKSGTNDLHGTLYEFLRNSALDANDYIDKGAGVGIPPLKMNQFGFAVGGPVTIPKLYNGKNRTFFFVDYQGTRRIQGATFLGTVPTDLQRQGDFSQTLNAKGGLVTIYNPFSTTVNPANPSQYIRTAFTGNKIPSSMFDPVAKNIIKYYPEPNITGAEFTNANNYLSNAPITVDQNAGSARIDKNVTDRYHFFGRVSWTYTNLTQPNTFGNVSTGGNGAVGTTSWHNWSSAFDNTVTINPTTLLTINYGFARWYQQRKTLSYGFDNSTLGFPASFVSQIQIPMFPNTGPAGYSGMAGNSFLLNGNDTHSLLTSLTKLAGSHTLTIGTDIRLHRINYFSVGSASGSFNFGRAGTQGPNPNTASTSAGDGMASMLLGFGSGGSIPRASGVAMEDWYTAAYIQDDFRIRSNLTLNMGLRYEEESPYTDRHNELNYFDPAVASPAANSQFPKLTGGLSFAGVNGNSSQVYKWNRLQFGPRFGFSYTPFANTVVRGGFGLAFAPLEISNNTIGSVPNGGYSSSTSWNYSLDGGLTPFNLLSNPYPSGLVQPTGNTLGAGTLLGQALTVWTRSPKNPQIEQWNFGIQRQFPSSVLVDIAYVGSHGLHLTSNFNPNQLDPSYLSMGTALQTKVTNPFAPFVSVGALAQPKVAQSQLLLPFPQFTGITEVNRTWGSSEYNSMQLKVNKRTTHGVSFLAVYTFGKLISNVSPNEAPVGGTAPNPQNYYNLAAERSISEMNVPHSFIANAVVQLPFGPGMRLLSGVHGVAAKLIGGWQASGTLVEQTGFPLVMSATIAGSGGNRPNIVPGVNPALSSSRPLPEKVKQWFNTAAFSQPAAFTYGNAPRVESAVHGPDMHNLDFSLMKETQFFDRYGVQFRADAFNLTNTPHFDVPDTTISSPSFGQLNSLLGSPPPREIQFALKVTF
jgi:Carboxypeptidase regulatory-like domain